MKCKICGASILDDSITRRSLCPYCTADEGVVALVEGEHGLYAVFPSATTPWDIADAGELGNILTSTWLCCVWSGTRTHPVSLGIVCDALRSELIPLWTAAYFPPSKIGCEVWVKKEDYYAAQQIVSALLTEGMKGAKMKAHPKERVEPTEVEEDYWLP